MLDDLPFPKTGHQGLSATVKPFCRGIRQAGIEPGILQRGPDQQPVLARDQIDLISPYNMNRQCGIGGWRNAWHDAQRCVRI